MLKTLPAEAGIDPAFTTMEDTDEAAFFDRAFDRWLSSVLDNADDERKMTGQ
jgi:hypothetical protein